MRARDAASAPSRLRLRVPGRRAPRSSAAGRRGCARTRRDGLRDAAPTPARRASCRRCRSRSRAACAGPSRGSWRCRVPARRARSASAPSNSTSADAFERLPSLSFSRLIRTALRVPSGRTRGSRKHVIPASACASTRWASHCGAEKNHLWPVIRQAPSPLGNRAREVRTHVGAALPLGHAHAEQRGALGGHRQRPRIVVARERALQPHVAAGESTRHGARAPARSRMSSSAGIACRSRPARAGNTSRRARPARRDRARPRAGSARLRRSQGASMRPTPDGIRSSRSARRVGPANATAVNADSRHRRARTFRPCRVLRPSA